MQRFRLFVRKSFIGGVLVIAPVAILLFVFRWLFDGVTGLIDPLANPLVEKTGAPPVAIDLLVIALIAVGCFLLGTLVSSRAGKFMHDRVDRYLARLAPGYRIVRDVVTQFLGSSGDSPFGNGEVALVQLYGTAVPARATAIVTSRHDNGWYTVFVPTGPNPTSGFVYHLPPDCVELRLDIKLDEAFRTIISCGSGSASLLKLEASTS